MLLDVDIILSWRVLDFTYEILISKLVEQELDMVDNLFSFPTILCVLEGIWKQKT